MQDLHDLEKVIRSGVPIIVIDTHEETRVIELFQRLISRIPHFLFKWTVTQGLKRLDVDLPPQKHNNKPQELLAQILGSERSGIYVLLDFHPYLEDPLHVRMLKDIAQNYDKTPHNIVLVSHGMETPPELARHCARFELSMPDQKQIRNIVKEEARRWTDSNSAKVQADKRTLDLIIDGLRGLPESDARRLARNAIENDGQLCQRDLDGILETKFQLLGQDGVLSFEHDTARFADVGGLKQLKHWLMLRGDVFTGHKKIPGLDTPKGIMLLGVQGCGKSLAAKAVSGTWGVPLLRLDFGTLYNKFYGETERNLRESLATAEAMAPCVLWVDEIEKAISTDGNDGGTSRRILGTLLTWLAENKSRVFIVSTANDIESLPPELLRKGRLDEIFFVDLPDAGTRAEILRIHLHKRELNSDDFDLVRLAELCDGFSGSEIEQAVVSSLYTAFASDESLSEEHLSDEILRTRPLSVVMAERIKHLRAWGAERTVSAN